MLIHPTCFTFVESKIIVSKVIDNGYLAYVFGWGFELFFNKIKTLSTVIGFSLVQLATTLDIAFYKYQGVSLRNEEN